MAGMESQPKGDIIADETYLTLSDEDAVAIIMRLAKDMNAKKIEEPGTVSHMPEATGD